MGQNETIVTRGIQISGPRIQPVVARRGLVALATLAWVVTQPFGFATGPRDATAETTRQAPGPGDRLSIVGVLRDADARLARAEAAETPTTEARTALADLARRLEELASDPPVAAPAGAALAADLRGALRDAARRIDNLLADRALADADRLALTSARIDRKVDGATIRALLGRVRAALGGDVALGLSFEGSYSQSRPSEPVGGGHASAMGPAPAAPVAAPRAIASPVTFDERVTLPARTWAGGPTKDHILESAGNGVALVDYDGDGWLDVYLVTAAQLTASRERIAHRNALYRNRGNWTFEDVSAQAGVDGASWGNGVCAGDVDGDGRIDLYVTNWGPNFLYRNRGDGTFEEIAGRAGVAAGGWSTGCAFVDVDADGDLDLYVARYVSTTWDDLLRAQRTRRWRNGPMVMVGPAGLPGESDLFFENVGGGRFVEATEAHGLADPARAYGFGVVTTDVDDDGHVDLFVANDSNPNFLYRNRGDGRFESVGLLAGVAVNAEARAQAGMGVDAGDADGDGRMDLTLTAFAHDRNTIYRNLGGGLFEDASLAAGLGTATFERMGWGVAFADLDLDGRPDLVVANGHIFADVGDHPQLGETFAQRNQVLLNRGGTFVDVSASAGPGLQVQKVSRGLAVGDLDNDGDPDVVVVNMDDTPTVLENRQRTGHHWIGVALAQSSGNRFGIGARVTVTTRSGVQVREVRSGGSYLSQGDLRSLFGLGVHDGPVTVEIRLPGGERHRWRDLAPDRYHTLTPGPSSRVPTEGRR